MGSLVDDKLSKKQKLERPPIGDGCNIERTHQMLLEGCRTKLKEMTKTMNIKNECIRHILHEELNMRKMSSR